ncbi:MAG: hypothetical protein QG671_3363, partial [Actinomycetota bacterium]|nr:hypothetical protein [Actinomycetota bacterium]
PEEGSWAADRPARDRKPDPEDPSLVAPAAVASLLADESVDSSGDAPATPEVRQPAAAPMPRATAKPPTLPTNTDALMTSPVDNPNTYRGNPRRLVGAENCRYSMLKYFTGVPPRSNTRER